MRLSVSFVRKASEESFELSGGLQWFRIKLSLAFSTVGLVNCPSRVEEVTLVVVNFWMVCLDELIFCFRVNFKAREGPFVPNASLKESFYWEEARTICVLILLDAFVVLTAAADKVSWFISRREEGFPNADSGILNTCVGLLRIRVGDSFRISFILGFYCFVAFMCLICDIFSMYV